MKDKIYLVEVKETYTYLVPTKAKSLKEARKIIIDDYNNSSGELIFAVDRASFSDTTMKSFIPCQEDYDMFVKGEPIFNRGKTK